MKLPWKIVRRNDTPEQKKLQEIKDILFPPFQSKEIIDPETQEKAKYQIDYSIDTNLDSVLSDMQSGIYDELSQKTINEAIKKLSKVRQILRAHYEIDKDAQYIIVDSGANDVLPEAIEDDFIG